MSPSIRVLYVDDEPDFADRTANALERLDERIAVTTATSVECGLDRLEAAEYGGEFDCVVSAHDVPGLDGLEFLECIREASPDLPVILFTGAGSEAVASEAIAAGVTDYLRKDPETDQFRLLAGRIRDHVERVRMRRELDRRRELLRHTEELSNTGGWEADVETGEQRWTDGTYRIHGLSPDSDFDPTIESGVAFYHPDDRERIEDLVRRCLETGDPYDEELRLVTADGRLRWVRTTGKAIVEDDEIVRVRGAIQDITERMERELELERSRAEFQELINGMNETAWVIDFDENFQAVNDAAVETLGYSRAQLHAMTPHDIDAGLEAETISTLIGNMPADEIQVFETVHETEDGERIPVEISSSLIHYRGETAVLSIARDISNRKKRELELERQKDRLDEFASVVSHDLRNPLNVAQGRLELAREDGDGDGKSSEQLADVAWALDRMDELIDDLLRLARKGEQVSELEAVELAALAGDCWQNVETPGATLRVEVDRTIVADRSRLQQLLENLFRNSVEHGSTRSQCDSRTNDAVEHGSAGSGSEPPDDSVEYGSTGSRSQSPDGSGEDDGTVTITVGPLEDGFSVEDDGVGIPEEKRGDVFDVGYSTSTTGTGFGLRIVEQVVEAHGWVISVTEGDAGGARFEITGVEIVR